MTTEQLMNLVSFLTLMQGNGGVINKSPDYIIEKYKRFLDKGFTDLETYWGLDGINITNIEAWYKKWLTQKEMNI